MLAGGFVVSASVDAAPELCRQAACRVTQRSRCAPPPCSAEVRRRVVGLRFFLFTLRRNRPVALNLFYDAVASTYAACGFSRQLAPEQLAQLAVQAGFSQTAAAALQRRAAADAAAAATAASSADEDVQLSPGPAVRRGAAVRRLPAVSIPLWRYKYFQWWLRR